jgi:hypothetical protein
LEAVRRTVAEALGRLQPLFAEGMRLTFVARHPTNRDAIIVVTDDEEAEVEAALRRLREQNADPLTSPAEPVSTRERAPDRYMATGRETIDRMRDLAHVAARKMCGHLAGPEDLADVADAFFAYHCEATALKYADRAGLKGDADPDLVKRRFYLDMAAHVRGEGPDPRANRPGFVPYRRVE